MYVFIDTHTHTLTTAINMETQLLIKKLTIFNVVVMHTIYFNLETIYVKC